MHKLLFVILGLLIIPTNVEARPLYRIFESPSEGLQSVGQTASTQLAGHRVAGEGLVRAVANIFVNTRELQKSLAYGVQSNIGALEGGREAFSEAERAYMDTVLFAPVAVLLQQGLPTNGIASSENEAINAIRARFAKFEVAFLEAQAEFQDLGGESLFLDTDRDGLSDFEETYLWGTNPNLAITLDSGSYTDGELVFRGEDPLTGDVLTLESYSTDVYHPFAHVTVAESDNGITLSGMLLPNTAGVLSSGEKKVLLRSDTNGNWAYTITSEEQVQFDEVVTVLQIGNGGVIYFGSMPVRLDGEALGISDMPEVVQEETEEVPSGPLTFDEMYATFAGLFVVLLVIVLGVAINNRAMKKKHIEYQ